MTITTVPPPVMAPTAPAHAAVLSVRIVDDPAGLTRYVSAWQDLADNAVEANVFYEPWMLLPAVEAFAAGAPLRFVLVLEDDPDGAAEKARLCGFFPLQRRRLHPRLPLSILGLWQHLHCYYGAPLVRADCADAVLAALFAWLHSDPRGASVAEFNHLDAEGPFSRLLREFCRRRDNPTLVTDSFARALLCPRGDGQEYLQRVLSGQRRRALQRRQRRLAERAALDYTMLEPDGDVQRWSEEFLQLESAGWKGRAGTAMASEAANGRFLHAIFHAAFERGRLLLCALRSADRPIAFRSTFLAGQGAFSFKMTYDEQYSSYSPGMLLEMDHTRRLHNLPELRWVDSCTAADNDMLNSLWQDRRTIHTILAATGRGWGRPALALYPWLRTLKRRLFRSRTVSSPAPDSHEEMLT